MKMNLGNPIISSNSAGNWQNIRIGSLTSPNSAVIGNSTALESGSAAGTYVWER